jgi:hypothetical protein
MVTSMTQTFLSETSQCLVFLDIHVLVSVILCETGSGQIFHGEASHE